MTIDLCTLPTAEQPLRLAEWDDLFTNAVVSTEVIEPQRAKVTLRAQHDLAARTADLAVRETECCSFFTFTLTATGGRLDLEIIGSALPDRRAGCLGQPDRPGAGN